MSGYVYFIKPADHTGPIKIGHSHDPAARLAQMAAMSPLKLELVLAIPGGKTLERNIQDCFADAHSHFEWFHPHPRLTKAIDDLLAGSLAEEAIDLSATLGNVLGQIQRATMAKNGTVCGRGARATQ